jgi:thioredoxin-dependent peroxiredoxin
VEGQALRDRADEFRAANCAIVGVSFDTPEDNKRFADAQQFGFPLLSDVTREVGRRYEVVREEDDQYAEFPMRQSFLIDPRGVLRKVYTVWDVASHADDVLADLRAM